MLFGLPRLNRARVLTISVVALHGYIFLSLVSLFEFVRRRISDAALEGWRLHVECTYFMQTDMTIADTYRLGDFIRGWQTVVLAALKADKCTTDYFGVPNFEVQQHWPEAIRYLGPVRYGYEYSAPADPNAFGRLQST